MKIVSVIPECFQEWPEESCSLGLFCSSCNFSCPWCANKDFITDASKVIGEAKDLLFKYINPMHSGVLISGGEPTVWKDTLIELLTILKDMKLRTKVFSNGYNFDVIFTLNRQKLVDMYSFDIKAVNKVSEAIGRNISDKDYLACLFTSLFDCNKNGIPYELRHTMAPGIDTEAVKKYVQPLEKKGVKIHYQKYVEYKKDGNSSYITSHEDKNFV